MFIALLAAPSVFAQATAQINGTVTDSSGGALPGATVVATQTDTAVRREAVTDERGSFTLTNLPIGPYRLDVTLPGFRAYQQTGLVLQVGSSPTLNITLPLGELTETVTVEAAAPLVDTQRAGIGEVIENERIVELPLNGRNPTDLVELAGAAVQTESASTRSFQGSSGGRALSVAGGQAFGTAYLLDGAMHNNPYDNLNLPLPFPDALQEFRVETGALAAGAGVHSGASVNAVTKSGTNQYHGDLFEFWRNHRFNASSALAPVRNGERQGDGLNRNQFGGTLGGPILRDRLFFFGGYQGTIVRQTPSDNIAFVPSAAMLAGDFTAAASPACNAGRQLTLRGPFVNNRVNPALFSPAAVNIAGRLPQTTDPCGRVTFGVARNTDEGQAVGRVDFHVSQNQMLFGRYMATRFDLPPAMASSDNLLTSAFGGFDNIAHSLTLGETWVMSSATVNAVRVAWNNTNVHRMHHPYFAAPDVGINAFSYLDDQFVLAVNGAFNIGSGIQSEARFKTNTLQVTDDLTMIRGNHQMAFGFNVARWDSFSTANVRSPGSYTVNNQITGLSLADFMTGEVSLLIQAAPNFLDMSQWYTGLYAADTWRVGPRVTVNYGLRWEPFFPQQIKNGFVYNFSLDRFNEGVRSEVFRNAPPGFLYPGDEGFVGGKSGMNRQWANLAPRMSVAWDPNGDGLMSLRAGYSLGYDFYNAQYHLNTSIAPPWGADIRVTGTSLDDPFAGFPGGNPFPRTFDADAPFPPAGTFLAVDPDTENTRQHSWNVAFQRQLGSAVAVSATYLGNRTTNLWNMKALNPGVFLGLGPCTLNTARGPQFFPVCSTQQNLQQRRRLSLQNPVTSQAIGGLDFHDASGRQNYHGLLLSVQRRSVAGISASANYTLSTCKGHPTQSLPNIGTGWADPENPDYDYGPCDADRRHIVNGTVGYQTPQFGGLLGVLGSDWRANGIFRAQSGKPLSVWTGQDRAMTGIGTGTSGNQRADQISDDVYGDRTLGNWLNRAAFAQPAFGTLGNSPRGGFRGPRRWTVDMVVARMFRVGDAHRFELRVEAFNLTNRVNPARVNAATGGVADSAPVTNLANPNFGRILQVDDPRIMQFAIKYQF
jgi:hypothetical protein